MKLSELADEMCAIYPGLKVNAREWINAGGKTSFGTLTFNDAVQPWTEMSVNLMRERGFFSFTSNHNENSPSIFVHDSHFWEVMVEFGHEVEHLVTGEPEYLQEKGKYQKIQNALDNMWGIIKGENATTQKDRADHSPIIFVLFVIWLIELSTYSKIFAESKKHQMNIDYLDKFINVR